MRKKTALFITCTISLLILCGVLARSFIQEEAVSDNLKIKQDNAVVKKEPDIKEDFNEIPESLAVHPNLTVSPTLELDDLIIGFEQEIIDESEEKFEVAIATMKLQNYKKNGGTMWKSEKWMKSLDYYENLETKVLAEECFSRPIFILSYLYLMIHNLDSNV